MKWNIGKLIASHIFADFGTQTTSIAIKKNSSLIHRMLHIFVVCGVFAFSLSQSTIKNKFEILLINICSHFAIDSFKKNFLIDQLLHLIFLLISIKRMKL